MWARKNFQRSLSTIVGYFIEEFLIKLPKSPSVESADRRAMDSAPHIVDRGAVTIGGRGICGEKAEMSTAP